MVEAAGHQRIDHAFAGVTERRVPEVVPQRDRFGQLLVQAQDLGNGARDLRHLERVRESRPIMVARRRKEDLGLVLQAAERLAVDDSIAVALKCRADVVFRLGPEPAARLGAFRRLGRQNLAFARLELLANRGQRG